MPQLLDLLNEILYVITGYLASEQDINSVVRTSRHLYNTINRFLYRFNAVHGQTSALLWAANHGISKTAQDCLNAIRGRSNNKLEIIYHALSLAVHAGHTNIAGILLSHGVDPNLQYQSEEDTQHVTFLARAAQAGHMDMVKLLLSREGINPNLGDKMGRPPIAYAGFSCQDTVLEKLLSTPGIDPDLNDLHGRSPLSWTVSYGSDRTVSQFLSRQDVNINAAMGTNYMFKKGWTALMFAINRGFTENVKLIAESA